MHNSILFKYICDYFNIILVLQNAARMKLQPGESSVFRSVSQPGKRYIVLNRGGSLKRRGADIPVAPIQPKQTGLGIGMKVYLNIFIFNCYYCY